MRIKLSLFFFAFSGLLYASETVNIHNTGLTSFAFPTGVYMVYQSVHSDGSLGGGQSVVPFNKTGFPIAPGGVGTLQITDPGYGNPKWQTWFDRSDLVSFKSGIVANGTVGDLYINADVVVTTNFTFWLKNNLADLSGVNGYQGNANAIWTWNGSVVKQQVLGPGQSASWTSPSVEVSPVQDTYSFKGEVNAIYPQIGDNVGGQIVWTNPSTLGTLSGSGGTFTTGGALTSGTNGFTAQNGSGAVSPSTNSIIWQVPSGLASESTLESGFSLLHSDNQSILAGIKLIDDHATDGLNNVGAGLTVLTNQMGQLLVYAHTNSDDLGRLIGILTNNVASGGTNYLSLTNYATEGTLLSISNMLFTVQTNDFLTTNDFTQLSTNLPGNPEPLFTNVFSFGSESAGYSNYSDLVAGADAASESYGIKTSETFIQTWVSELHDWSSDVYDYYPSVDMTYQFTGISGGSQTIDFDPLHYTTPGGAHPFDEIFTVARKLFTFLLAVWFFRQVTEDIWKCVMIITNSSAITSRNFQAVIKPK